MTAIDRCRCSRCVSNDPDDLVRFDKLQIICTPPAPAALPGVTPPKPPRAITAAPTVPPGRRGVCHACRSVTLTRLCVQCNQWFCQACAEVHQEPELPSVTLTVPPGCEDEIAIMELVSERLRKGRREYGPLNLSEDGRNLITEALEEALDQSVYLAGRLLQLRRDLAAECLEAE